MAFLRLVEKPVQLSASSLVTEALRGQEMSLVGEHRELITKAGWPGIAGQVRHLAYNRVVEDIHEPRLKGKDENGYASDVCFHDFFERVGNPGG